MNLNLKISVLASVMLALGAMLWTGRASAAVSETCTIGTITFQTAQSGSPATGTTGEAVAINCSNDNTNYMLFVGSANACNADLGNVQSLETIMVAARASIGVVTIWYTSGQSCGGKTVNIINSVTM